MNIMQPRGCVSHTKPSCYMQPKGCLTWQPHVAYRRTMLLENKNAVIYGGGGAIGGAVARVFAREGARVFIAGRTREKLDAVAADIAAAGGRAETARVDAFDQRAVEKHADAVAAKAGRIDIAL